MPGYASAGLLFDMSTMARPRLYPRQHAFSTSRNLLNLDCSADLESYRRDLGPGVQAKCFEKTSDTIQAQLDDHRAAVLWRRQNGQAAGFPSPVPRLEVAPHAALSSNTASTHEAALSGNYHTASHPRPMRILSQPHAPQHTTPPIRRVSPVSGHVGTYPEGLRYSLERCSHYGHQRRPGAVWEVIVDIKSNHMDNSREATAIYDSLQEANMHAANMFLFDGYCHSADEATFEVNGDGGLKICSEAVGSRGGRIEILVKSAPAKRTLGPERR